MTWPPSVPKPEAVESWEQRRIALSYAHPDAQPFGDYADAMLAACAEVIERLCVCGNCGGHNDFIGRCVREAASAIDRNVNAGDPCHFTPSRWTPCWDAERKAADA